MEKLFTVLGATALIGLVIGLSSAPAGSFPWSALLCVHFVNLWLWIAAYVVISRRYKEEKAKPEGGAASVLFLLALLTITLILGSVHNGLLVASERGILLGDTVYTIALSHPLAMALPNILLGFGALAILVTMRGQHNLSSLIEESDAARIIRRLNGELKQEKQKLQTVVEGIRAGLALTEVDGTLLWSNDIYNSWFSGGGSLAGKDSRVLLKVPYHEYDQWPHDKLRRSKESMAQGEHMLTLASGQQRPFLVSAYILLDEDSNITGHLQLLQDVSKQKELQTQLLETEKLSAVGQLIGSVAHELNNPLAILIGYSEMALEDAPPDENFRSTVEQIRHNTVRCQKVVKNLLSFVRRYKDERVFKGIRDPMAAVLELKRYQLLVDNIQCELECPHDIQETMIDEHKLQQVFLNLVNNAHDALVDLRRPGKITLGGRVDAGWIVATVADDGPGIPEGLREKIMQPFFTTKAPGRGTGLGLSICKNIIEDMGGTIALDSQAGKGTTFTIRLPILPEGAVPVPKSETVPSARGRILVVDDEPELVQQLAKMLTAAGHDCTAEQSAGSALARLEKGERYDLVLCDLKMPGLDGLGFADRITAHHRSSVKYILFLSGDTANPRTREWVDSRGIELVEKPYTREELLRRVSTVLAGPAATAAPPAGVPN